MIAYLSGEMTSGERERFETHLGRCPSCAHEVESRRPVLDILDHDRAAGVDVPAELGQLIRARLRSIATSVDSRPQRMPQAAAAMAAMCFLAVGLAIGYVAGRPATPPGMPRTAELPKVNEEELLQNLIVARQQLAASGKTDESASLEPVGRLLEQLAELKGDDISHVRLAASMPAPLVPDQPMPVQPTTPDDLKRAYEREISENPGTSKAALAQVKLAELYFKLGKFREARPAYALFKSLYPDQYQQYAHRTEVDQRLRLLAESDKYDGYRSLVLFREAVGMSDEQAFNVYENIIERQPIGQLARMAVMEMTRFEWADGRLVGRTNRTFGSPQEKIEALGSLIEIVSSPDVGALAQTTVADIYRDELGDLQQASEVYESVYEKYPEQTLMASEAHGRMIRLEVTLAQ